VLTYFISLFSLFAVLATL